MFSDIKHEVMGVREQRVRGALLWFAAMLTFAAFVLIATIWLFAFAWKRQVDISDFERGSPAVASYPMQLGPLIAGRDKATVGNLVYLTRVVLTPGPTPKVFFLTGSHGTQILTVAEGAHIVATPGRKVNVRGTIRNTPSVSTLRKQWKLSLVEARRVSEIPIYIESDYIRESGG